MSNRMFTCGVPGEHCSGATVQTSAGIRGDVVYAHNTHEEAFKCRARYLVRVWGYQRVGQREFRPPDGGPILVLTKKSRFGGELRKGKAVKDSGRVLPRMAPGGLVALY
jgi:hypothetical protein